MSNKDLAQYNGVTINFLDDMVNLTNMWKAVDGKMSQGPHEWLRLPTTVQFVDSLTKKLNTGLFRVLETRRGRQGGTYAHQQIALAYAKYLSPDFHMWANQAIRKRRIEEMLGPHVESMKGSCFPPGKRMGTYKVDGNLGREGQCGYGQ